MAEFMFNNEIKKRGLEKEYCCESRAVSYEEEGNDMYFLAKKCLDRHNVPYTRHFARRIEKEDYDVFDEIYIMDKSNRYYIDRIVDDEECKINMLNEDVIPDPWPCGNFDKTYEAIMKGIERILR